MENQKHTIHQLVVEADFYDKAGAQDVFKQISLLFSTKLHPVTNEALDTIVTTDTFLKIDQLEIELGTIAYPINDTEFSMRYEAALKQALANYEKKITASHQYLSGDESKHFIAGPIELLHFYLINGVIPWWASGDTLTQPDKTFLKLLKNEAVRLKELLQNIGKSALVRKRLTLQFDDTIVKGILQLMEPAEAEFIVKYHKDVVAIQEEKKLIHTEGKNFRESLWYFILTYLLVDLGGHFERRTFIKSTLTQMAAHFNVSYQALLFLLSDTLEENPRLALTGNSFPILLLELKQEAAIGSDNPSKEVISAAADPWQEPIPLLNYYLHFGSLPTGYYYTPEKISLLLHQQLKQHPTKLMELFYKNVTNMQFVNRLMPVATEADLLQIIEIAEPSNAKFIIAYYQSTLEVQNKKSIIKTEENEFKKAILHFILTFLFMKHDSVFSAKMFVEHNVKQLARHFNIDYKTLLLVLTQGFGEDPKIINSHFSLFFIFTDILNEERITNKTNASILVEAAVLPLTEQINKEEESVENPLYVKDVILFWLLNGYYPWWAGKLDATMALDLFQGLMDAKPDLAVLLLKQAMYQGLHDFSLLSKTLGPITLLLKNSPNSAIPLQLFKELEQLSGLLSMPELKESLTTSILKSLLQAHQLHHFNSFNQELFLSLLVENVTKTTHISKTMLITSLNVILKKTGNAALVSTKLDKELLVRLRVLEPKKEHHLNEFIFLTDSDSIINLSMSDLVPNAYAILSYYLQHNKLPDTIKITENQAVEQLIKQLFLIVFEQDQNLLHSLFQQHTISIEAKMTIHKSFSKNDNQQARNISTLLKEYEENDILEYVSQILKHENKLPTVSEVLYFIKQLPANDRLLQLHKELVQLDTVVSHYAAMYKEIEFINLVTLLSNKTVTNTIRNYSDRLSLAIKDSFERERLLLYLREFSFSWIRQTDLKNTDLFYAAFLDFLYRRKNWNVNRLQEQIGKASGIVTVPLKDTLSAMEKETGFFNAKQNVEQQTVLALTNILTNRLDSTAFSADKQITEEAEVYPSQQVQLKKGEKVYISNAGLVLLHPFLSTLFQRTNMLENGQFVNEEAKNKAPHLLQYLVDHSQENKEQDLLLNKLLCGILPNEVLSQTAALTQLERETADDLLFAVTQQWEKLKNTSINGLQASFLQREGSLSLSDEGWTLLVENKAYDILLQTLPWGLSFIKNSWMEQPIFVEWN